MLVVSASSYSDFKSVAGSLRKVDAVFYNQNAMVLINGAQYAMTVAYAFDFERNNCVFFESSPPSQFVTTDFTSAVPITGHLSVSEQGEPVGTF